MSAPDDRKYSETHEWHKLDGDTLTLGLSKFAVDELTDITYVDMKPVGATFDAGDAVGEVESVKATSDVYCSVGGEIIEINPRLEDDPSLLNSDPYGEGWLIKVRASAGADLESLMPASEYQDKHGG